MTPGSHSTMAALPLPLPSPFFSLTDGQMSPLDSLVHTARSLSASPSPPQASSARHKPPFLSPLSTAISYASPSSSIYGPPSPHSPLLHTRFGTPSREPHSPAGSEFSQYTQDQELEGDYRSDFAGSGSDGAWSPRSTTTGGDISHGTLSHLLDEFERNAPPVLPEPGQDHEQDHEQEAAALASEPIVIGPIPPGRKRSLTAQQPDKALSPPTGSGSSAGSTRLSPVLPGWQGSYFPPPERYRAPRSAARTPVLSASEDNTPSTNSSTSASNDTPGSGSGGELFPFRAYEAALSPPVVVINSPDEPSPGPGQSPSHSPMSPAFAFDHFVVTAPVAERAFDHFVVTAPVAEREREAESKGMGTSTGTAGRARSYYTSGNFSRPRISISPVVDAGDFAHEHVTRPPLPPARPARTASDAPQPIPPPPLPLASPLQLQTSFARSTTPPELSAGTAGSADTSFGFPHTPARAPADASAKGPSLSLTAPPPPRDITSSPATSVYSDYSYYSVDSESSDAGAGTGAGTGADPGERRTRSEETMRPELVRGDSVSGRYVKLKRGASDAGSTTSTSTASSTSTATVKPPRPPPPKMPITRALANVPPPSAYTYAWAAERARVEMGARRELELEELDGGSSHQHQHQQHQQQHQQRQHQQQPHQNPNQHQHQQHQPQHPQQPHPPARHPPPHPPSHAQSQPIQHLHLGIAAHEADDLRLAAEHFEKAAKLGGGCAVGMVMWGLTLRHGWGARKDEVRGFGWLKKGVERALGEWEAVRRTGTGGGGGSGGGSGKLAMGEEWGAVKEELVLALGEVARCFMHGWGVKEDKKMGFNYFLVAANLGDADSAQEVAFCYEKARGVKRDKVEAARWYRRAVRAGVSDVGLAWIWKSKYD